MNGSNEYWIEVDGSRNLPAGKWLVRLEKEFMGLEEHTVSVKTVQNGKLAIIAGHFDYDLPKVVAYRPIPL